LDGTGVRVAVLDSGLDLAHADFPVPFDAYDMTDGDGPPDDPDTQAPWDEDIASAISGHGTHVAGTVLGRGTYSGGLYKGMAPGAELCFYKIGGDVTSSAMEIDMVEGVERAASQGCRVLNMSYGGLAGYLDGSEAVEQAIDAAFAQGMLSCISAGNSQGTTRVHDETVAPGEASPAFTLTVTNQSGSQAYSGFIFFQVIWRDGAPDDLNASLELANLGEGETFGGFGGESSPRGTEAALYLLAPNVPPGEAKVYSFSLANAAAEGDPVRVFVGAEPEDGAAIRFSNPTGDTLVGSPAVADEAIAVAATVHRTSWINYQGSTFGTSQPLGQLATFSSHGPRVDGALKPDVAAPGSMTISALNSLTPPGASGRISDDGSVDGEGPVHYTTSQGTSMASPACAGVAALLFQANPSASPGQVREALLSTAALGDAPDSMAGHGLIDAPAAVLAIQSAPPASPQGWVVRGE
jgi:subtilisin family serine protease